MKLFRCSNFGRIMTGAALSTAPTITDAQAKELEQLKAKDKLTDKQAERLKELQEKATTTKRPTLSAGAKSFIEEEFMNDRFGFRTTFTNKYIQKGNECEQRSIEQVGKMLGYEFATKAVKKEMRNEWLVTNGYDWKTKDFVFDQKNVWNPSGLKLFDDKDISIYEWQIRAYAMLLNEAGHKIKGGAIVRVLMNPPEELVFKEARKMWADFGNGWDSDIPAKFVQDVQTMFDFEGKFPDVKDRCRIHIVDCSEGYFELIRVYLGMAQQYYERLEKIAETGNDWKINLLKLKS
jgi:hypothetical protein